jgi:hypothetical protein
MLLLTPLYGEHIPGGKTQVLLVLQPVIVLTLNELNMLHSLASTTL